jgi:hypothetical protein
MIECPNCRVAFSPRHALCPRCKTYEAKLEDRISFLESEAEAALDDGIGPYEVQSMLEKAGVPRDLAYEVVSGRAKNVARGARSRGLKRMLAGLGIFLLSGAFGLIVLLGIPSRLLVKIVFVAAIPGVFLFLLGLRNLLSGRD